MGEMSLCLGLDETRERFPQREDVDHLELKTLLGRRVVRMRYGCRIVWERVGQFSQVVHDQDAQIVQSEEHVSDAK